MILCIIASISILLYLVILVYPTIRMSVENKRFFEKQEKMRDMHNATRQTKNKNATPGKIVHVGNGLDAIYDEDGEMIWNSYIGCCGKATYV